MSAHPQGETSIKFHGQFLFTSPKEKCIWQDILTHRESVSLGAQCYREALQAEGLVGQNLF